MLISSCRGLSEVKENYAEMFRTGCKVYLGYALTPSAAGYRNIELIFLAGSISFTPSVNAEHLSRYRRVALVRMAKLDSSNN